MPALMTAEASVVSTVTGYGNCACYPRVSKGKGKSIV